MKILSRRTFVRHSAIAATGVCLCGIGGCATITGVGDTPAVQQDAYLVSGNRVSINLNKVTELEKVGGSAKIVDEALSDSLIIVHSGPEQFIASSIHCTHRGTEVEYLHKKTRFQCASIGGSEFGLDGKVLSGPAKGKLQSYPVTLSDTILVVTV